MNLETIKSHDGWIARPAGKLGTMGWHPFPWEAVFGLTPEQAERLFRLNHEKHLGGPPSPFPLPHAMEHENV